VPEPIRTAPPRLGFYQSLADEGPATSNELGARTGTAERYMREWLEQQTVAGFLTVDEPGGRRRRSCLWIARRIVSRERLPVTDGTTTVRPKIATESL
jgi:hypothetical protein